MYLPPSHIGPGYTALRKFSGIESLITLLNLFIASSNRGDQHHGHNSLNQAFVFSQRTIQELDTTLVIKKQMSVLGIQYLYVPK